MKTKINFGPFVIIATLIILGMTGCSTTQIAHPEWDDAYFNSADRAQQSFASRQARQQANEQTGTYPNNYNNNGSINNYPANASPGNYGEANTQNPNGQSAAADYVNPNYRASTNSSNAQANQNQNTTGTTYVTNNYYDEDYYYRSPYRSNLFSPYTSFGYGYGGPVASIGFGYNYGFGWNSPYYGYNYGWGYPYGRSRWGWNSGWSIGFGYGCAPYYGYGSYFDPFWGFGYNPYFYDPYWGWNSRYWGSPYAYGGGWNGNTVVYYNESPNAPTRTNNPAGNMSGNINPNKIVAPGNNSTYTPPSTGGRVRGDNPGNPGGQPTSPDPSTNSPQRGTDHSAGFRPTPNTDTPPTYRSSTTPESYTQPPATNESPGRQQGSSDGFRQTPTPSQFMPAEPSPGRNVNPAPEMRSNQRNDFFRNDGFRQSNPANNNSFRNNNGGGQNFGGGNRGGGGFTPPPSGGRRRGQ